MFIARCSLIVTFSVDICMFIYVKVLVCVCLSVIRSVCLSVGLSVCVSGPSVCFFACVCVFLPVSLCSLFLVFVSVVLLHSFSLPFPSLLLFRPFVLSRCLLSARAWVTTSPANVQTVKSAAEPSGSKSKNQSVDVV